MRTTDPLGNFQSPRAPPLGLLTPLQHGMSGVRHLSESPSTPISIGEIQCHI